MAWAYIDVWRRDGFISIWVCGGGLTEIEARKSCADACARKLV